MPLVKQLEVKYCLDGYHLFRSVEHNGLHGLLQTSVDTGMKYGKINVDEFLTGRKVILCKACQMAKRVKNAVIERVKQPIDDGMISMSIDLYTDDYRKKAFLD